MKYLELRLDQLVPDPNQPRKTFDEDKLNELAQSMGKEGVGLAAPLVVRPTGEDRYMIICGERRWKAAKKEGLEKIPVVVRTVNDEKIRLLQLAEDFQKEEVSAYERGKALWALKDKYSSAELAQKLGISRGYVSTLMTLVTELDTDEVEDISTANVLRENRKAKHSAHLTRDMASAHLPRQARDEVRKIVDEEAIPTHLVKRSTLSKIREEPKRAKELLREEALGIKPEPKVPTNAELDRELGLPESSLDPIKNIILKMGEVGKLCSEVEAWDIRTPEIARYLYAQLLLLEDGVKQAIAFVKAKAEGVEIEGKLEYTDVEYETETK